MEKQTPSENTEPIKDLVKAEKIKKLEKIAKEMLIILGEDVTREGLIKTPTRMAKSWLDITNGYTADIDKIASVAHFTTEVKEMIVVKDIPFYSACEHHFVPFFGVVHVGYIPEKNKVIGLSKIPRLVEAFSRRLQIQERMTCQIAQTLQDYLKPLGVGVIVEGRHLCMEMRGVEKTGPVTTTSEMLGVFATRPHAKAEFLDHIARARNRNV